MTREDVVKLWGSHPILKDAPPAFARRLADAAVSRRLSPSQPLCGETERTGNVWIVARGVLHVTVQSPHGTPVTVDLMRPGEAFGYLNCFSEEAHVEDVSALTQAEVIGIPSPRFLSFIQDYQPAAQLLLRETAERMRALIQLRASSTEPARARVRTVLRFLYDKMGRDIPMTRPMIAMVAGLTTETVSRALAPLSRKRIIVLKRGGVRILHPEGLKDPR